MVKSKQAELGKTRYFQALFLYQDKLDQGRKVKSWCPRQKESAQESQTGSWRAASSGLTFLPFHPLPPDAPEAG